MFSGIDKSLQTYPTTARVPAHRGNTLCHTVSDKRERNPSERRGHSLHRITSTRRLVVFGPLIPSKGYERPHNLLSASSVTQRGLFRMFIQLALYGQS